MHMLTAFYPFSMRLAMSSADLFMQNFSRNTYKNPLAEKKSRPVYPLSRFFSKCFDMKW